MIDVFCQMFGGEGRILLGQAPGRVNLIGDHTDYHQGFVFPMALGCQMTLAARAKNTKTVRVYALDLDSLVEFSLETPLCFHKEQPWVNYIQGVLVELQKKGVELSGMDIAFGGTVPQGAGLSSSAALEVVTGLVVGELHDMSLSKEELIGIAKAAENNFVGVPCGIMDQFISVMGKEGYGLLLDCKDLSYEYIPITLSSHTLLICDSKVKHSLMDSSYEKRQEECAKALFFLQKAYGPEKTSLREVSFLELEAQKSMGALPYKRARHVLEENARVLDAACALKEGQLVRFGTLMTASHGSLSRQYEVSCEEIDFLVEKANSMPGVLGSRMTGAGFGGCMVTLLENTAKERFMEELARAYEEKTGISPAFYEAVPSRGARIVKG